VTIRGVSGLVQEPIVFGRSIASVFIAEIAPMKIAKNKKRMRMIDAEDTVLGDILIILAYLYL